MGALLTERADNAPFTPVAVQPKLDGVGVVATRDGLTSTQGKPISGQKFLKNRLRPFFALNPKAELKGELYRHGKPFEDVLSKVRTGKGGLQLHVFPDGSPGQKLPLPFAGIRRVRTDVAETPGQLKKLTKAHLKQGYEGSIVRDAAGGVAKIKPFRDAEFPVVSSAVGPKGRHGVLTLKGKSGTFKAQAPLSVATSAQPGQPVSVTYSRFHNVGAPRRYFTFRHAPHHQLPLHSPRLASETGGAKAKDLPPEVGSLWLDTSP